MIRLPGGSNSGGSSGGGAPSGSAGGSLTGTYPNPTIATIPSGATATTQTAADGSTKVATTAYTDTADALKANIAGPTFTGITTAPEFSASGLTGATGASRYVGATASGAPVSGTFVIGDFIIDRSGAVYVCTTAGSPGTWTSAGGAPSGAAGGSLTGTYPNPTIATIPSGATATTQSASDGSTKVATTAYTDTADALKANLASPTLTGTPAAPTAAVNTNTTQLATTAAVVAQAKVYGISNQIGPGTFAATPLGGIPTTSATMAANGDARWIRVMMGQSGTLHDVSFLCTAQSGNYNVLVLDDGQANGTHTVRTCLYIKGSTAMPAAAAWLTGDASLTVAAGDTLVFLVTVSDTTGAILTSAGATGSGTLPNSSFFPGSGASTNNTTVMGTALSANIPTTTSGGGSTITNANLVAAAKCPWVCWRIS